MTGGRNITLGLGFKVDKSGLNEIIRSLQILQSQGEMINKKEGVSKEIEAAVNAAKKLQSVLKQSWNSDLNQLDLNKLNSSIKNTYGNLNNLRAKLGALDKGNDVFDKFTSDILNTNVQLKQSNALLNEMTVTMTNTVKWGITSGIFNRITDSIQEAWNYTKALDSSLNDIRIVTGKSADEMASFAVQANKVAKSLGSATKDYTNASLIYYQQGLSEQDVQARAQTTLKAANVTGQSGQEVSEQLTAVWNGYKVSAQEAELYVDKLAAVAADTAADLEELSTGMSKVASAANLMGVDIDQLNAQLATIVSVTRQAPESVGTALKTIYARMGDIKAGLDGEVSLDEYTYQMGLMGVNVLTMNGELRDMGDVIQEIGDKWTSMSREQQISLSQTMAGTRQYNNLLSLFDNWDMYTEALNTSSKAAGTLQKQQDIYMESTSAHLQKLATEAERTYDIIFDQEAINSTTDALTGLLSVFNSFLEGIGGGTKTLTYFGGIALKVFNKQFGSAITTQIENVKNMRRNADELAYKEQIANNIVQGYAAEGISLKTDSVKVQTEAEIAKQLLEVKDGLTQEEYNELTLKQQQLGTDKQILVDYEKQEKALAKHGFLINNNLNDVKTAIKTEQDKTKELEKQLKVLQETKKMTEEIPSHSFKKKTDDKQKIAEKIQKIDTSKQSYIGGLSEEKQKKLAQIIENSNYNRSTVLKKITLEHDNINKELKESNERQKEYNKLLEEGNRLKKEGSREDISNRATSNQEALNTGISQAKTKVDLQDTISTLGVLISTITALDGAIKNIKNGENIFSQLFSTLISVGPIILMNLKEIKSVTKGLFSLVGKHPIVTAAVMGIAVVIKVLLNILNKQQEEIKKSQEELKKLTESYREAKNASDDFKNSISEYKNAVSSINKLTKGTIEYTEAVISANQKAMELINTNRMLAQYAYTNEQGILSFTQEGLDKALQSQLNSYAFAAQSMNFAQINAEGKTKEEAESDILELFVDSFVKAARTTEDLNFTYTGPEGTIDLNNRKVYEGTDENGENYIQTEYSSTRQREDGKWVNFPTVINGQAPISEDAAWEYAQKTGEILGVYDTERKAEEAAIAMSKRQAEYYNVDTIENRIDEKAIYKKLQEEEKKSEQEAAGRLTTSNYNADTELRVEAQKEIQSLFKDTDMINALSELAKSGKELNLTTLNEMSEFHTLSDDVKYFLAENNTAIMENIKAINTSNEVIKASTESIINSWLAGEDSAFYQGLNDEEKLLYGNIQKNIIGEDITQNKYFQEKQYERVGKGSKEADQIIQEFIDASGKNLINGKKQGFLNLTGATYYDYDSGKEVSYSLDEMLNTIAFANTKNNTRANTESIFKQQQQWLNDDIKSFSTIAQGNINQEVTSASLLGGFNSLSQNNASLLLDNFELLQESIVITEEMMKNFDVSSAEAYWEVYSQKLKEVATNTDRNIVLTALMSEELKELDYDEDDFKDYVRQLQTINEELETNEELAKTLALQNIKLNKGLEDLGSAYEDYENILKSQSLREANKHTAEYGEAIANMQQALEKVFGTKPDSKFIEDNFEQIKKLAEGDISVLDELQKKFATLKLLDPEGLNLEGDFNSTLTTVQNLINNAQLEDLKVGMSLDDAKLGELETALQQMITYFGLTAEDANKILESIGFTPTVEQKEITFTEAQVTQVKATKEVTLADGTTVPVSQDIASSAETGQKISIPVINAKAKSTYIGANKSGINRANTKAGKAEKKGGSDKKPDKKDLIEEKKDVYHDINIILKQISTELDRLEKQEEKLVGQDLIDNLNEQWGKLQDTIDATNEKIKIARGEMARLQGELGAKGVTFNPDGTIANYAAAYNQQLATVNAVINHYNSLSAEAQEGYKDTVEQAEKNWEEFLDDIEKYDETVSELIPELEDEIQAAIDEQIEIQIEKFNMEIELRLDMAEAEREWNEFKKRIIDDIEDNDILGNASAKLLDYNSYYKEDGTGVIQKNTQHVNEIIEQLKSIEATGTSSIYGDNEAQALEDLKTYYEQLMSDLTDVHDLIDEIRESYLDMMDEAQEKFDEQVETYEYIRDLLTHDMDLITMVYGDEAYDKLVDFYEKQEDNYNKQLDFQRQQKDFWKAQMDSLEEGSDEWQKAKENWMSAVEEWNSLVEEAIENLQDKYLNAINNIFANLNDKVTDGLGLDYVEQEWDLINKNADQYLDTINAVFETQQLENKYLDAIDNTDNISAQRKLNDLMKEEIKALEQKDKLTQYDIDRANLKYEIALKQIALEEAQQTKSSMRLRRDSQGNYRYEFVADNDAIAEAEDELSVLQNQLYNMDVEQYRSNLDQLYEIYVEWQEALAEAAQINDPEARAERELMINEQYGELINGIVEENEVIRTNLRESAFDELINLHQMELEEVEALSQAEKDIMLEEMVPQWTSGVQTMADTFAGEGGFIPTCKDALIELDGATKDYEDSLLDLQYQGGFTFNDIVAGENEAIYTAMGLLQVNNELINSYKAEFDALNAVLSQLDGLIGKYGSAQNAANAAAEAAYKYADALLAQFAAANGQYTGRGSFYSSSGGSGGNVSSTGGKFGVSGTSGTGSSNSATSGAGASGRQKYHMDFVDQNQRTQYAEFWASSDEELRRKIKAMNPHEGTGILMYNMGTNKTAALSTYTIDKMKMFNTGGYTGEWNSSEGKLAMLHQKELVLNQRDTENILGAVEIMRHVTNSIDNSIFARVADFTSGIGVAAPNLANEALEQNVHIEANFPNVQNSNEVEEALNNLVNIAAQRANRNNRN